jgi:hypothetical protein
MSLWGGPISVNVQKLLCALTKLGLSYNDCIVGGKYMGLDAA